MKVENINFENLHCTFCKYPATGKVTYILYPMAMAPERVEAISKRYATSVVVISGMDWDNDMTPWPAPGEPKGAPDFQGLGGEFFRKLTQTVAPSIEKLLGAHDVPERTLIGVSLSGLFTLWQWAQSDFFHNIATLSGSFWYKDFVEWIWNQPFSSRTGRCFMLLGEAEPHSRNRVFSTVGKCTEEIVGYLRRQGVDITYRIVAGNHYQYPTERLDMAMADIYLK